MKKSRPSESPKKEKRKGVSRLDDCEPLADGGRDSFAQCEAWHEEMGLVCLNSSCEFRVECMAFRAC